MKGTRPGAVDARAGRSEGASRTAGYVPQRLRKSPRSVTTAISAPPGPSIIASAYCGRELVGREDGVDVGVVVERSERGRGRPR